MKQIMETKCLYQPPQKKPHISLFETWEDSKAYQQGFSFHPPFFKNVLAEKGPRLLSHTDVPLAHSDLFILK